MLEPDEYQELRDRVEREFPDDIPWSEGLTPCDNSYWFAREAIFVICNSGMHNKTAAKIYEKVMKALDNGRSAHTAFRHIGKCDAMDHIWGSRDRLFRHWLSLAGAHDEERLDFLKSLRWIGDITKWHLAKNLGMDVMKPDRWLVRLAEKHGTTPYSLCRGLAKYTGDRVATVDLVLWRACAEGWIAA